MLSSCFSLFPRSDVWVLGLATCHCEGMVHVCWTRVPGWHHRHLMRFDGCLCECQSHQCQCVKKASKKTYPELRTQKQKHKKEKEKKQKQKHKQNNFGTKVQNTHTQQQKDCPKKTFVQWIYIPKFEIGTLHETKRHVSNIQLNWPLDTQRGKRAICIQQMAANDSQRHCNFGRREPHRCLKYSLLSVGKTADTLFQCQ